MIKMASNITLIIVEFHVMKKVIVKAVNNQICLLRLKYTLLNY